VSAWRQWFPPLAVGSVLLLAVAGLFQLRLGSGDVYPEYSSLRADALGTRALYEALGQLPGMEVARDYRPVERLTAAPRLVLLPGLEWQGWLTVPADQLAALHAAAGGGARVVLAFRADLAREKRDEHGRPAVLDEEQTPEDAAREKQEKQAKAEAAEKEKKKLKRPGIRERKMVELATEWNITPKLRWLLPKEKTAQREAGAPDGLPPGVAWKSDLYFAVPRGAGWQVLYRRGGEPVVVEKVVGRGTIVLVADAYGLSNEAMQRDRATGLLTWLVGGYRRAVFLEGPLGVLEENGVGFLARRYGLGGALALCALLGALYAWRRLVAFMPPEEDGEGDAGVALAYEPAAGITGLLRRSLGPDAVLPACVEEWRKGRRSGPANPSALARLEAAWAARDPRASPTATYNALVRALKPR
jgi:hypothetical protein